MVFTKRQLLNFIAVLRELFQGLVDQSQSDVHPCALKTGNEMNTRPVVP